MVNTELHTEHPEITRYRKHLEENRHVYWFIHGVEIPDYEEKVEYAIKVALPRLWAYEFEDATGMPEEYHALVELVEKWLGLDLTPTKESDSE